MITGSRLKVKKCRPLWFHMQQDCFVNVLTLSLEVDYRGVWPYIRCVPLYWYVTPNLHRMRLHSCSALIRQWSWLDSILVNVYVHTGCRFGGAGQGRYSSGNLDPSRENTAYFCWMMVQNLWWLSYFSATPPATTAIHTSFKRERKLQKHIKLYTISVFN